MAGIIPQEGEALVLRAIINKDFVDLGTDLELFLFTNVAPGDSITEAAITEPTGDYARITLATGTWTGANESRSYPVQKFTAGVGGWPEQVQGYGVCTTGTTKRIITLEVDPTGPLNMIEGAEYDVIVNITVADSAD